MKYFLDTDSSAHWYVIPWDRREEWELWAQLEDDDERAWTPPEWAKAVNGSPSGVVFENPQIGGYVR